MRIYDFLDDLSSNLNPDLSEITNPRVKIIRKLFPVPMVATLELAWDKDLALRTQNDALDALNLRTYIQNMLQDFFLKEVNKKKIEEKIMVLSQSLKKEADEKLRAAIHNEQTVLMQQRYAEALAALQANKALSGNVAAVMAGVAGIKAIDGQIAKLNRDIQEIRSKTREEGLNLISTHDVMRDLQHEERVKFLNFVEDCSNSVDQRVQNNPFYQRQPPIFPQAQGLYHSFGKIPDQSGDIVHNYKIGEIFNKAPEFFKSIGVGEQRAQDSSVRDLISVLIRLRDASEMQISQIEVAINELHEDRAQLVEGIQDKMAKINITKKQLSASNEALDLFELNDMVESVIKPAPSTQKELRSPGAH